MTTTQGDLAALSKYIFRAPRWYASVGFALLVGALTGLAAFDSSLYLEDMWQGIFYIGLPTVAAALGTTPVDRMLGGQLTYNRSSLLALACEVLLVAIVLGAGFVAITTPAPQRLVIEAFFAGLALVFAVRLLVMLAISRNSWLAVVPASIQTATTAVLLFVYSGTVQYLTIGGPLIDAYLERAEHSPESLNLIAPVDFVTLGVTSVLYAGVAYGFVRVLDRPWRRGLGVSVLDFARGFVGHIAEGTTELEEFFADIGEQAVVPVSVLAFRRPDGTEKARFVLPMIHPGPMGEIGGGNLPKRVAETAEGVAFPPHATAGHDFNLVTREEVETLIDAADRAHANIEYDDEASASTRVQVGDAKVLAQAFGGGAFLVATYAPEPADDIAYAVGLSAAAEARAAGFDDVVIADAHNCNNGLTDGPLGHVYPGSKRSFDTIEAAGDAGRALQDAARAPLRLGTAWRATRWTPEEGVGPLGIRVAAVDAGDHTTVYVLVDGNNMVPGLREKIIDAVPEADAVEVMTTDTHVVNTVESTNQVGDALDEDELVAVVADLAGDALADREPVEAGAATERAEVTVFGNDRTETLASHANAMVTMGGALAAAFVVATMAITILVLLAI